MTPPTGSEIANYGLWIQTGAIVVSAIGVIATLLWQKKIFSRRATLDLVMSEQTDPGTIERRTKFVTLRDEGHLSKYADPQNTHSEESEIVRSVLNKYELVAVGIGQGTIDEASYKKWCRTTLVKDWIECKPFIMQLRRNANTPTYFCEFEALARKWANKDERPHI